MSLWHKLFGGKGREQSDITILFEKINTMINNDDTQNSATLPMLLEKMIAGGGVDVVPNAIGDFGHCITNPIPVNGPLGEITYLSRLLTISGEKVYFHRLGSIGTIDVFELVSQTGTFWDILYVDMYHTRKTKLAPAGYSLQGKTTLIRGITSYIEDFPNSFYAVLCERTLQRIGAPIADPDGGKISGLYPSIEHKEKLSRCHSNIQGRLLNKSNEQSKEWWILDRPTPSRQFLSDRMQAGAYIEKNFSRFQGLTHSVLESGENNHSRVR